jgi:hypothetical protein
MASKEKADRAAEQFARTTAEGYKTAIDHAVALQERNVRFAQGVADDAVRELRGQAESNRQMTLQLVERAENQRHAFQELAGQSVDAYMDFVFAPLSYAREGLREAGKAAS